MSKTTIKIAVVCILGLAAIPISLALAFYWRPPDPAIKWPQQVMLTVYTKGRPGQEIAVSLDSPLLAKVDTLIKSKQGQWHSSFVSFAPTILLRGQSLTIDVKPKVIVVHLLNESENYRQLVADISSEEYDDVEKLVETQIKK